ncbi:MAG: PstS family phosphate ABC transporter substrate-binding protein [Kofleriaceae bacterium]|nr:PstS family phosphate ABC transporter substrate-binding protein [Kofleriaceae bacterium]
MNTSKKISVCLFASALILSGCGKGDKDEAASGSKTSGGQTGGKVSGAVIKIDGSSTVFPITQAVAEEFQIERGGRVTVGVSGTGGGFKKFCRGEIALSGASRPIKPSEVEMCKSAGIEFIELPIAYDGIAIVVNVKNTWVDSLTTAELKKMWSPEAEDTVTKWSDIREGWPDKDLQLLGPGVDSGTYDYFTKAIVGKEHSSRGDFAPNEDDNVLVHGVSTDEGALGYFGFAYYAENKNKLKLIPIDDGNPDNGDGPIAPSSVTVADGSYQPLARPIFIYVAKKETARPEVAAFVDFYLNQGRALVAEVGYIPLPDSAYDLVLKRFTDSTAGSMFEGGSKVGASVETMLKGQ